ncbi:MAG TPA: DUF1464 family protein [Isosphaeraceae bacterium]|nr:DUF1464 family protein [Isosphaeraceae bacterium]
MVGTDPGTSSLDLLLLVDGQVKAQARLLPDDARRNPDLLMSTLRAWEPITLVAGPSGYGLPLVPAERVGEAEIEAMSLVRPDERGSGVGVIGFRTWVRALLASGLPVVFLPGGIHLPPIPAHRKVNTIDMGTPDKVAVAALALYAHARETGCALDESTFAVLELGTSFSAILVVEGGRIVDASAGTRGPLGIGSAGAWDGEAAYWLSPLSKADLFRGGLLDLGPEGPAALRESLRKHAAGLRAVTPFDRIYLSGAALERPDWHTIAVQALEPLGDVRDLPHLPAAWVKHAAQGSALLADGLAGGENAPLVDALQLRQAAGSVFDHLPTRASLENRSAQP